MAADIAVICLYLLIINLTGLFSARPENMDDYFLGGKNVPWPLACFSIVATETSTLTFISIPGLAYVTGLGFLQVALGYILGRILIAVFFIPQYYEGRLRTVYEYLQIKFGPAPRMAVSVLFHITRILADAIRLFATAIPVAMLLGWNDYRLAVVILGAATVFYTISGGIKSVVIIDSIQLFLYLFCAAAGIVIICSLTGFSFPEILSSVPAEKIRIFSFDLQNFFSGYNAVSGILCGCMLSMASHGTDHLMVQRILTCSSPSAAGKAMIWSGILVFVQFFLFLVLGICIWHLFGGRTFDRPDEVMPYFIINTLPSGMRGLMIAGLLSAAMSSLSSTVNSMAASTTMDILKLDRNNFSGKKKLKLSRMISFFWMVIIVIIACLLNDTKSPLVELGLGISSLIYGGVLAVFFQARFFSRMSDRAAVAGMTAGIICTVVFSRIFSLSWTWYIPAGFLISMTAGIAGDRFISRKRNKPERPE